MKREQTAKCFKLALNLQCCTPMLWGSRSQDWIFFILNLCLQCLIFVWCLSTTHTQHAHTDTHTQTKVVQRHRTKWLMQIHTWSLGSSQDRFENTTGICDKTVAHCRPHMYTWESLRCDGDKLATYPCQMHGTVVPRDELFCAPAQNCSFYVGMWSTPFQNPYQ